MVSRRAPRSAPKRPSAVSRVAGAARRAVAPRKAAAAPKAKSEAQRRREIAEKWATYSKALIITAHPDDAEFIAGGTIASMAARGWDVTLAIATSGDKGTRDESMRPQELAAIREAEQRAAAEVLGVGRCVFLGYPDGFLVEGPELRGRIVLLIRTLQPDVIVTWDGFRPGFNHSDHRVVGRVVRDALYPAAHDPHYYPEHRRAGAGPWRTAEALFAASDEADYHVDISPHLEQKVDAILCHRSQVEGSRDEMLKRMRARGGRNSAQRKITGYDFAESFKRIEFRRPPGAPGSPPAPALAAGRKR